MEKAAGIEAVLSNNDWVVDLLAPKVPVLRPPFFDRNHYQGAVIRAELRAKIQK